MSLVPAVPDTTTLQAPDVLNVEEVAEYLRIPRSSVYKLAKNRRIPSQKAGRQWRFSRKAIDDWLAASGRSD